MRNFAYGVSFVALVWLLFTFTWYIQLGLIVNDCDKYGLILTPGKIYECRVVEK